MLTARWEQASICYLLGLGRELQLGGPVEMGLATKRRGQGEKRFWYSIAIPGRDFSHLGTSFVGVGGPSGVDQEQEFRFSVGDTS